MSITATGPFLLLLALYVFFFKPERLAYYAVFFAPFSATAIINLTALGYKSGGLGLTPAMAFTLLFFAAQILYGYIGRSTRMSTGHLIQLGLIVLFVAVILFSSLVNGPISSYQFTQTTYVLLGLLATMLFSLEFARDDGIDLAVRAARASAIFVSLWGLLQLFCSLAHLPYPSFLFNNSSSDAADMFAQEIDSSLARIASVAVEPSVMATALLHFAAFGATAVSYDARLRTRYWLFPVGLSLLVLLLSTSSTAYVGIATLGLLLSLQRPIVSLVIGGPIVVIVASVVAVVPRARDLLLGATISKTDTLSYLERTSGAAHDLAQFYQQPLLGFGWGAAANFNALSALLCNVGLIGAAIFITCGGYTLSALSLASRDARDRDWPLVAYAAGARNALIVAAACAITSGIKYVFLDDWVFWGLGIAIASRLSVVRVPVTHSRAFGGHTRPPLQTGSSP